MFHSDAKVRDALNRGLCPDCGGPLTVRLDDPCHEVTLFCNCRKNPLGLTLNQDDVYPEVLELGRRQQQPEPSEKPSARMLRALSDLRDLSLMENHRVSDPADRYAVELARHLYATVRAVDVDKLRQRSLLEGV